MKRVTISQEGVPTGVAPLGLVETQKMEKERGRQAARTLLAY